jgi:hypothetical protein
MTQRRRLLIGATGLGIVLMAIGTVAVGAQEDQSSSGSFTVKARADALSIEVVDTATPVAPGGQAVYGSPATAQAVFTSLGESTAFASSPYPGDFVASLPPTVNGISGGNFPPLPSYPFIVATSYPSAQSAEQTNGPYGIVAHSTEGGSDADAHVGLAYGSPNVAVAQGKARALRDGAAGTLTAEATSSIDAFAVGPLLRIGEVSGYAKLIAKPGEKPTKETRFSAGSVTVLGVTVGLTSKGIVPGQGTPPGLDLSALTSQLAAQGVTLQYLPSTETDFGVTSASLLVRIHQTPPNQQPATVTLTLGGVTAQVEPRAGGSGDAAGAVDVPMSGDDGSSVAGAQIGGPTDLAPSLGTVPLTPGRPAPAGAVSGAPVAATRQLVGRFGTGFFLVLIGLTLSIAAITALFSGLGIRGLLGRPPVGARSVLHLPPP